MFISRQIYDEKVLFLFKFQFSNSFLSTCGKTLASKKNVKTTFIILLYKEKKNQHWGIEENKNDVNMMKKT